MGGRRRPARSSWGRGGIPGGIPGGWDPGAGRGPGAHRVKRLPGAGSGEAWGGGNPGALRERRGEEGS